MSIESERERLARTFVAYTSTPIRNFIEGAEVVDDEKVIFLKKNPYHRFGGVNFTEILQLLLNMDY